MDAFEREAIIAVVGQTLLSSAVRAQLPFIEAISRSHGREGRLTEFRASPGVPKISPSEVELAEDLAIAGVGSATAHLTIRNGCLTELFVEAPTGSWPERPEVLGVVPSPDS